MTAVGRCCPKECPLSAEDYENLQDSVRLWSMLAAETLVAEEELIAALGHITSVLTTRAKVMGRMTPLLQKLGIDRRKEPV